MQIAVNGQCLMVTDAKLVSNSVGIYEAEFTFDSSWDGFAKTSVWQLNNDEPKDALIVDGVAEVPWESLVNGGFIRIGVRGTKGAMVKPTIWGEKHKVNLGTPSGESGTEPTPSIYAQILAVATEAKEIAEDVQNEWESVTAEAETLPSGSEASVEFENNTFAFGIPQGEQGGDGFSPIVAVTPITNGHRVTITDAEGVHTFDVLDGTDGADGVGITNIVMNADYTLTITLSNGTSFTTPSIRGEQGETGNGIESITKTATVGKVDTYTITYTDGTTTTFDVTNGEVTEASLEEALYDKADIILNSASGSIASFSDGSVMPVKSLEVEINAVQSGSGDPSPTNIRPISGWDAVNVVRTGKNRLSPLQAYKGSGYNVAVGTTFTLTSANTQWTDNSNGVFTIANLGSWAQACLVSDKLPSGPAQLRIDNCMGGLRCSVYVCDGNFKVNRVSAIYNPITDGATVAVNTTIVNTDTYIVIYLAGSGNDVSITSPRIYAGADTTDISTYEPYNGTTYPITLPQTVYGGKIKDGVLTIDSAIVDLSTQTWRRSGYDWRYSCAAVSDMKTTNATAEGIMCSAYNPSINSWSTYQGTNICINQKSIILADDRFQNDVAGLVAWFTEMTNAGTPVMFIYPLATPIEITLSDYPTITTLTGENNLWTDSGDVAVIYRADTKKYIDGTIVDVPLAMIAPIENGTTASKAYAVGEYFILNGNQFCKAKTAIASGATFTLNTNYTVTTIGAELKALA